MPTLLLTRPHADSERLAAQLTPLGYRCVIEPLLTVVTMATAMPNPDMFGAVMISSANALTALAAHAAAAAPLRTRPCFCVGSRTASRARESGFHDVHDAAGDGPALARLIARHPGLADTTKPLLHIAGRDRDGKAEEELRRRGIAVVPWVVYAAEPARQFSDAALRAFDTRALHAIPLFSARTAETLKALILRHRLEDFCANITAIALSATVAERLRGLPWANLAVADHPREESLIARLRALAPGAHQK